MVRELFREYQQRRKAPANFELLDALRAVQEDARRAGLDKLTVRQIDAEAAATRRARTKKTKQPA